MIGRVKPNFGAGPTVALIAAIAFPLLGGWQIDRTHQTLLADAQHDALTLSHSLAQHASRTIEEIDLVLSEIVDKVEEGDSSARLQSYMRHRTDVLQQLSEIAIINEKGDWTNETLPEFHAISSASRSYFAWHRDHGSRDVHIGDMIIGQATGRPTLTLSRRIDASNGAFAGVARAGLNPAFFQSFYDSIDIGPHGTIGLFRDDGELLVRHPAVPEPSWRGLPQGTIATLFQQGRAGVAHSRSPIDGVERLVAFEHLEHYPLVVTAAVSVDDALANWRHEALIEMLVLLLASTALISLAFGLQRHQRQAALSESASRRADAMYRLLAENSTDLIAIKQRDTSRRAYVSPSSTQIIGWSPEEFTDLEASEFIHPDDQARVQGEFDSISPERPRLVSQHRVKHKAGHYIWLETSSQFTTADTGVPIIVVAARDITARRVAEEALKDSEARYRLLADSSSDMITRSTPDGVRLYVSPASFEVTGYQPAELVGTVITQFIHPDDVDGVLALIEESRTEGVETARLLYRFAHKLGNWIWVEVQMRHVRHPDTGLASEIVASVRDVTERQLLQQQVEASARLLRLTLDSMDQGLLVLSPDRRCNVWNARALSLLELTVPSGQAASDGPATSSTLRAAQRFPWIASLDLSEDGKPCEHRLPTGVTLEVRHTSMPGGESLLTFSDITHLKRAESEAREANRMLMLAEELALVGHWRWDLSDNRLWWSQQIYRIHGIDPDAGPPTISTAIELYHPDDRSSIQQGITHAIANREGYSLALRAIQPDGAVRHVLSRNLVEVDAVSGEVVALFGALMDVTELAHTQRELSEKSSLLEATLNNMDQGLVTLARDGSVSLANRRFAELLGLPASLLSRPTLKIADVWAHLGSETLCPDGSSVVGPGEPRVIPAVGVHEHRSADGRILEVRTGQLPNEAFVQTYSDITVRRQAEWALRDSEARYRMLAETTSDVITQLDLDFKRRYVSSSCRSILGYEPEEMLGVQPSASIHPDDVGAVRAAARELIAGAVQGGQTTQTYRAWHKQGHWVWLETAINLVCDPSGAPESLICSLRDVTERQRIAQHLEGARAAAENATRLKTEFVANMSHELRTPLTGILGIHDILEQDPTLGPTQKRYVSIARDAGRTLLAIVNDVLDFSKIEAGELTIERVPFDVSALIQSCYYLASEQANGKPLEILVTSEEAACTLLGDPTRLRQIVLNLVTNSIKFTERGTVSLVVAYRRELGRLRIDISDTGIGIAPEQLPLLFKRFSQADTSTTRKYGGTGLGLAISKRLVELMGGEIGVASTVGRGTTFWIELPLSEVFQADPDRPSAEHAPTATSLCRVLLAEDNVVNQEIISAVLEQRGHAVTIVENGAAATAAVVGTSDFDIILMDVQMPVMDGLSATRAIRAAEAASSRAAIPIIGLTANAMLGDVERCRDAGMDLHVAKPIEWNQLLSAIDEVIASRSRSSPRLVST